MAKQVLDGPWKGRTMAAPADGIIVHAMSEYINGSFAPDFLKSIGLSVHAFIGIDGTIYEAAATDRVAYHAGKSAFEGRKFLNNTFLGFELLVEGENDLAGFYDKIDNGNPFTEAQYEASAELCKEWMGKHKGITLDRIVGHSEVSGKDVRPDPKRDPGKSFNWEKFKALLK